MGKPRKMLLSDVLRLYGTVRRIGTDSAYQLDRSCRLFGEHLGRAADTRDLSDLTVSEWIAAIEKTHSQRTVAGHRTNLLCVWRFAAKRGLARPPCEVRIAPKPDPQPQAWTLDEVQRLIAACDQIREEIRGVWMPDWLRAEIEAAYWTGLRRSDLWRLRRDQIGPDGVIVLTQHKTRRVHSPKLPPGVAARVLALPGSTPLAWPGDPRRFYELWERLLAAARVRHGALQQLRRTGASWVARESGVQAAREFLAHKTEGMVKHYLDPAIAQPIRHQPPQLPEAG